MRSARPSPRTVGGSDSSAVLGGPVAGFASLTCGSMGLGGDSVSGPADLWVRVSPSVAHDPSPLRLSPCRLPLTSGTAGASHVPGASLHAYHALGGPRPTLRPLPWSGALVSASGAFNPSPSACAALTGRYPALQRAVSPAVSVVPWVRFTSVVRFSPPAQVPHAVGVVG
jgi:hypothetical protein